MFFTTVPEWCTKAFKFFKGIIERFLACFNVTVKLFKARPLSFWGIGFLALIPAIAHHSETHAVTI